MISSAEQKIIKKAFGVYYSPKIVPHLAKKKITNIDGTKIQAGTVRKIVGRFQEHLKAELEIVKLAKKTIAQNKRALKDRKAILK